MRRLGPELKMPELKAPDVLVDLYWDLRDRRLLPLVVLALVAIVAVPFLLGGGSDEPSPESPATAEASTAGASGVQAARLTVVESKPGLRDYRKRLRGRTATDPFVQRHSGPMLKGAQLSSQSETSSTSGEVTSEAPTTEFEPAPTPAPSGDGGESGGGAGGDGDDGEPSLRLFTFAIDVQISRTETRPDGSTEMGEPATKRRVLPTTPLPGEKAPVVTYMGANVKDAEKALLMVSNNVKSVFGDGKCLSGTDTCQLLEVEPGFPQTFVYGPNDVRYKIKVLKIEPVLTGRT